MSEWSNGYVSEINYTYGYYHELNPGRIKLAFLYKGLEPPEVQHACELGFGQGISINIHAAGSAAKWHGTDFNPSQTAFAQNLARVSQTDAELVDQSFAEFCLRDDLPQFDSISMHGIWSWVSQANQALIVDFVRRKLKVGGVLYVSYNAQPGLAQIVPLRHLLSEYKIQMVPAGKGVLTGINEAVDFVDKLFSLNTAFGRANPAAVERLQDLQRLRAGSGAYLAHEYLNGNWLPMSFSELAAILEPAKLNYACSASYHQLVDTVNLTPQQIAFLDEIPNPLFRETVRDFCINQAFRQDYWVRGAQQLSPQVRLERLREVRVVLGTLPSEVGTKIHGPAGEANMNPTIHGAILSVLADYQPKSILQIEQAVQELGIKPSLVHEVLVLMSGSGHVHTAQDAAVVEAARAHTSKLNAYLLTLARADGEVGYLASPVTGGGIPVSRFGQLFMLARSHGFGKAEELAQFVDEVLRAQGQRLTIQGVATVEPEAQVAELTKQARIFIDLQLPLFRAMGVCD